MAAEDDILINAAMRIADEETGVVGQERIALLDRARPQAEPITGQLRRRAKPRLSFASALLLRGSALCKHYHTRCRNQQVAI